MSSPIRVSCAMLCRFKVNDRYLLLLNHNRRQKGIYELSPVGGAIEFQDRSIVAAFDMQLEKEGSSELRFFTSQDQIDVFRRWFYRREGREIDPFREIYEELVDETGVLETLRREDLDMRFWRTIEDARPTQRQGVTGMFTWYFIEIFEAVVTSSQVAAQLGLVNPSTGVLLLDEATVRSAGPLQLHIDGLAREVRLVTDRLFP